MDINGLEAVWQSITSSFDAFYDFLRAIPVPFLHINVIAFIALVVICGAFLYLVFGELLDFLGTHGDDTIE